MNYTAPLGSVTAYNLINHDGAVAVKKGTEIITRTYIF
jgi:hypothetical protein